MLDIKKLNKAILFVKNKDFDSAEKIYYELLRDNPNNDTVLSFWGLFNMKKGLFNKAEKILESAYKLKKAPSTIAGLAYTKYKIKKYDDAIILYEELFRYDKESEIIYQKIIECFRKLYMYDFANAYCRKYLASHPDSRHALSLITQSYMDIKDFKKAEEYCARTLELYPDNPSSWINAGFLQELFYNNEEVAQECYKKAIENKDNQGYYHLAVSLQKSGKYKEAETNYKKALEYYPDDADTKASLGALYWTMREFENGYKYFTEGIREKLPDSLKKLNQPSDGKNLLVYCDQGLGDNIMYSRYLPYLKEKYPQMVVYSRKGLSQLFKRSFPNIEFLDEGLENLTYDSSMFLSYVPYFLNMDFNNIPSSDGYLRADDTKIEEYHQKYFQTDKLKVGLCWKSGDMAIRAAIHRTINIDYLKPLLEMKNIEFYSFQKDDIFNSYEKYPQIINLSKEFKNFDDTASAMKNLDLMISVDTSNAHLAGALGIKTILLLPYCSDWRWFDNVQKTEWYNSVEIIKQEDRHDWYIETDKLLKYINQLLK